MRVLVSVKGVEGIEVLYLPGQRAEAWFFYQSLMPAIQDLDESVRHELSSDEHVRETQANELHEPEFRLIS